MMKPRKHTADTLLRAATFRGLGLVACSCGGVLALTNHIVPGADVVGCGPVLVRCLCCGLAYRLDMPEPRPPYTMRAL